MSILASSAVGTVGVMTSSNGGMGHEHFANRLTDRIVYVGDQLPGPIRDQAHAFRDDIRKVATLTILDAVRSDRGSIKVFLQQAGMHEAAALIDTIKV